MNFWVGIVIGLILDLAQGSRTRCPPRGKLAITI